MIKYETKLRELLKFVPEPTNFEEYLCSKFEEGLSLERQWIFLRKGYVSETRISRVGI